MADLLIEPLVKSPDKIQFGWKPVDSADTYKVYASQTSDPTGMTLLAEVSNQVSRLPTGLGMGVYDAEIADVQSALSLSSDLDFSNTILYFAVTYVSGGVEDPISASEVVEVPPVGVTPKVMKDDPSIRRQGMVFSDSLQRWTKMMGSGAGAVVTDSCPLYAANTVSEFTYDGSGNVLTEKTYLSDRTSAGSPAKLKTYEYTGSDITKITITDSTV